MTEPLLAIGLMSGTSADGVDVAIISTDGRSGIEFVCGQSVAYDNAIHERLIEAARRDLPLVDLLLLEQEITLLHATAVEQLVTQSGLRRAEIAVIGFHGHTLRHDAAQRITWQIGNASLLAERTKIPVVSDFRRRDLASGGQGAPLATLYHAALVPAGIERPICVLNLGGVGNVSYIGKSELIAGDTGPGCGLLDSWVTRQTGLPFDRDGELAATGKVDLKTVQRAMQHPFIRRPLPKSADRFEFDDIDISHLNAHDGAATLCAITAESVVKSTASLPERPKGWLLTGGGVYHPRIVKELRNRLENVQPITAIGARPDLLEAECFAWLAVRHVKRLPTSLPSTTGAACATIGGLLTAKSLDADSINE